MNSLLDGRAYDKQKSKLAASLEEFIQEHHGEGYHTEGVDLNSGTPLDVVTFLVVHAKGRTQVHAIGCDN